MEQRTAIIDTVTTLFWSTDHHDWDHLAEVFADRVRLDYTAMVGGEPTELTPGEVVAGWRPGFDAIDAHQHLVSNHLVTVDGDRATVTATFIATHQWHGETWTLGGDYLLQLHHLGQGWRVSSMAMTPIWQTGNPGLIADAVAASSAGS